MKMNSFELEAAANNVIEIMRGDLATSPEQHVEQYCRSNPNLEATPQAILKLVRRKLLNSLYEDKKLIEDLSRWMWEQGVLINSDKNEKYVESASRKTISTPDSGVRHSAQTELIAYSNKDQESKEAESRIAQHAGFLSSDQTISECFREVCRSAWHSRLSMRVKSIAMLEIAGAKKPSGCRFSNTCNSCSTQCPRLWGKSIEQHAT
jgi:hypothetical protein